MGGAEALPPPPRRPSTHLGNAEDRVRGIERVECAAMIVDDLKILINLWLITIVINNSREYLVRDEDMSVAVCCLLPQKQRKIGNRRLPEAMLRSALGDPPAPRERCHTY